MLKTVSDITDWLSIAEADLLNLHTRMQDDLELWRLEDKYPEEETDYPGDRHHKMVRNDARALAEKVIGTLLSGVAIYQIPLVYGEEGMADLHSNLERMLHAFLEEANDCLRSRLEGPLNSVLANYACLRGWICGLSLLRPDDTNRGFVPNITPWEPIDTFFTLGESGVSKAAHRYWETERQLALRYPRLDLDKDSPTQIQVVDFWEIEQSKIYNSIVVGDDFAKKPTRQRFKRFPVFIIPAPGPVPAIDSTGQRANVEDWGESIFATNRQVYRELNRLDTETLDVALREAHRGLLLSGPGAPAVAKSIDQSREEDIAHAVREQVMAAPIPERRMPGDLHLLRMTLEQAMQRGGLSFVSWGQIPGPLAALAIANLSAQEQSFITPRVVAMTEAYKAIALAWMDQLVAMGKDFEILVRGKDRGTLERLRVGHLTEYPTIEVKLEPKLVGRELQSVAMALQMRQRPPGGFPMISDETILEKYIGVEDPRGERDRILREMAMALPFIQLQKQAIAFRAEGMHDYARILEMMADRNYQEILQAMAPPPARSEPFPMEPQVAPMPPPEAMPPSALFPPETMSPEAMSPEMAPPGIEEIQRLLAAGLIPAQ